MSKTYFSSADSFLTIIKKVVEASESKLVLEIPQDNIFWQAAVNKKLLEAVAAGHQKELIWPQPSTPEQETTDEGEVDEPASPVIGKKPKRWRLGRSKVVFILLLLVTLFVSSALAFIYYYLPRAELTLTVEEKTLEGVEQVELVPDLTGPEPEQSRLPAQKLSVTENEEETFAATGEKEIGEKAVGTVTVQNWADREVSLAAGTTLIALDSQEGSGLEFVTTEKVVVPAQTVSQPEPGKKLFEAGVANVGVEAARFGKEYNLSAQTEFAVGDFDRESVLASNASRFSGGTTEQLTVVSASDLKRSQDQFSAKLFAKGRLDLESKLAGDQRIIEELITHQVLSQSSSVEEGGEAREFSLEMKTQSQTLIYSESELKNLLLQKLAGLVPEGYRVSTDEKVVAIQSVEKTQEGVVKAAVKVKTLVIPDFDLGQLRSELLGKHLTEVATILSQKERLLDYQIKTWPLLPDFLRTLPHRPERLSIKVEAR